MIVKSQQELDYRNTVFATAEAYISAALSTGQVLDFKALPRMMVQLAADTIACVENLPYHNNVSEGH